MTLEDSTVWVPLLTTMGCVGLPTILIARKPRFQFAEMYYLIGTAIFAAVYYTGWRMILPPNPSEMAGLAMMAGYGTILIWVALLGIRFLAKRDENKIIIVKN